MSAAKPSEANTVGRQEEEAWKVQWPDFPWRQPSALFTCSRGHVFHDGVKPYGNELEMALRWYWCQLRWRTSEHAHDAELGVSWKELAIDYWAATGVIARPVRSTRTVTSLQLMAETFAAASRQLEQQEAAHGGWLWRGGCTRTSSLAPFGQRAAVAGLSERPLLLRSEEVGFVLCGLAAARSKGESEDEVETWTRRSPPSWRRWGRPVAEVEA